jgi:excisionase family DNA binding protein
MEMERLEECARFSAGQLAQLVQASRNTIVRYIEAGRIRAKRRAGGQYVISREEVLNFLWDLSFSKVTPLGMWRAATLAYDRMKKPAPKNAESALKGRK